MFVEGTRFLLRNSLLIVQNMLSFRFLARSAKFAPRSSALRGAGPISAFSTVPQKKSSPSKSNAYQKPFSVDGLFASSFEYKGSIHGATSAMTGQYAVVTEDDVKSVPEGFAGEVNAEFEAHGNEDTQKHWMIRDSSKLVCRLLDSFKAQRGSQRPAEVSTSQRRINLDDYGMRSDIEWHDAVISVEHYGKELLGKPKINFKAGGEMYMDRPTGDLVNDYMYKIKEEVPEIPDRILLTGKFPVVVLHSVYLPLCLCVAAVVRLLISSTSVCCIFRTPRCGQELHAEPGSSTRPQERLARVVCTTRMVAGAGGILHPARLNGEPHFQVTDHLQGDQAGDLAGRVGRLRFTRKDRRR